MLHSEQSYPSPQAIVPLAPLMRVSDPSCANVAFPRQLHHRSPTTVSGCCGYQSSLQSFCGRSHWSSDACITCRCLCIFLACSALLPLQTANPRQVNSTVQEGKARHFRQESEWLQRFWLLSKEKKNGKGNIPIVPI